MARKLLGGLMLASPFAALFVILAYQTGVAVVGALFGAIALAIGLIIGGIRLLSL